MTEASSRLQALARELARVYLEHTGPRAILLTGSAAVGEADVYSDLDLIVYYDELPDEPAFAAARVAAGARDADLFAPATEATYPEYYYRDGVQCQVAHETVASWEAEMRTVLVELDVESPVQKAISGLFEGIPLHGGELIDRWRSDARYPDALARAMVERHWRFFPIWRVEERLATRDATLWRQQVLVESAYNLLAVLAGLNRVWFTSFQFKREHDFASRLGLRAGGDRRSARRPVRRRAARCGHRARGARLGDPGVARQSTCRTSTPRCGEGRDARDPLGVGRLNHPAPPANRPGAGAWPSPPGRHSVLEGSEDRDESRCDQCDEDRREDEKAGRQHHLHRCFRRLLLGGHATALPRLGRLGAQHVSERGA